MTKKEFINKWSVFWSNSANSLEITATFKKELESTIEDESIDGVLKEFSKIEEKLK